MAAPTAERHPEGLDAYWLGVWRHALKVLKVQGTWAWEHRPLLDEYVFALIEAKRCRDDDEGLAWHRAAQRASALADQLVLTPRARKAHGLASDDPEKPAADPLAGLDELAARRRPA